MREGNRTTWAVFGTVLLGLIAIAVTTHTSQAEEVGATSPAPGPATTQLAATGDLAPLPLVLPKPMFVGTPKNIKLTEHIQKLSSIPRAASMAPKGAKNVALNAAVTSSDSAPTVGELAQLTDGDKEGKDGSYFELGPGLQWVQIDLGAAYDLHAILLWHFHGEGRIYHDVIVQTADDADFIENVRTLFNNDYDNSEGLGIGKDKEYFENYEGKLIEAGGARARYVRLYTHGNTSNDLNHYTEVEVYGK